MNKVSPSTPMQRVLDTLMHREPDKVPLFLLFGYYGAKELGITPREYFKNPDNVVEAQMILHRKYRTDCLFSFHYASIELEAMGGNSLFFDDGPPNAGKPIIKSIDDIKTLYKREMPPHNSRLTGVLKTISLLRKEVQDRVPIISVVMSPFSMPVMQLGFERYLNILLFDRPFFDELMRFNMEFCVQWANAQVEAGSTAICYFDPVLSPSIISNEVFLSTGFEIARKTISQIKASTGIHLASGISLPIIKYLAETGTSIVGVSSNEDRGDIKRECKGKLSVLGNLNGVEMCRWKAGDARKKVKELIDKASMGGGFILSDNHGEIPWYVKPETLMEITMAVEEFGYYNH